MPTVDITITGITNESFPVFISFELQDSAGRVHGFADKLPVIHDGKLSRLSLPELKAQLPIKARMRCTVVSKAKGQVEVDTAEPDGIVSLQGETRFRVPCVAISGD